MADDPMGSEHQDHHMGGVAESRWAIGQVPHIPNQFHAHAGSVAPHSTPFSQGAGAAPLPHGVPIPEGAPLSDANNSQTVNPVFDPTANLTIMVRAVEYATQPILNLVTTMVNTNGPVPPGTRMDGGVNNGAATNPSTPAASPRKSRREKTGPKAPVVNELNRLFRDFLAGPQISLCDKGNPSEPPSQEEIDDYLNNNVGGPSIPRPRFDWYSPMTTGWNAEQLTLIRDAFLEVLESSPEIPVEYKELHYIENLLINKITPIGKAYRQKLPPLDNPSETNEQRNQRLRERRALNDKNRHRYARRTKLWERRKNAVEEVLEPDVGAPVLGVLDLLTADGMSSDETDTEQTRLAPKTLRRVVKPWVNAAISDLVRKIDRLPDLKPKPGNVPRVRNPEHRARSRDDVPVDRHTMIHVPGLPRNFYDSIWLNGLKPKERESLDVQPDVPLPLF